MARRRQTLSSIRQSIADRLAASEEGVDALVSGLTDFLERELLWVIREMDLNKMRPKEAAKALKDLEDAMREAGLGEHLKKIESLYGRQLAMVDRQFEQMTGKRALLSAVTRDDLAVLTSDVVTQASRMIDLHIGDVRSILVQQTLSGTPLEVKQAIKDATGTLQNQLRTELNTSTQAFSRAATMLKAEKAGFEKFLYVGPDDKVTRPFCKERVNKIYTMRQIRNMDNEQGLDVVLFCGGYNCRHQWSPVDEDQELFNELKAVQGE